MAASCFHGARKKDGGYRSTTNRSEGWPSSRVVLTNWTAMLLWAALIVLLGGIGLLTLFVGMILLFPVLGYATWHSDRRLVA